MENNQIYRNLSVGNFISIFYRIGVSYLSQRYEKYQIGYGQYQFLISLYLENGMTQDELTKRLAVDKATTTRAINKLKELDYVTVSIDTQDKRIHHVWLTEKAMSIREDLFDIAHEWDQKLLHSLTEDDKEMITSLFYQVADSNDWLPPGLSRK